MKRYEIHAETQLAPNTVTPLIPWSELYHAVVVGSEPDEIGKLHAVCGEVVHSEPWGRALREWPALTDEQRCPVCDKAAGDEVREQIERLATPL